MTVTMGRRARADEFTAYAGQAQQRLFRQAVLLTGEAESARDLVQATLVKLYVAWPRIDTPGAYAQRTMVRTFLDGRRKERREAELHRPIDPGRAEPDPAQALTVRQAIAALPPRMRAVVVLRYWEDLTVDQTAAALGCSSGNVKSTASRGLDRLRDLLGDAFAERTSTPAAEELS
ncbi:SigE family RNA polymerase sigma factor [Nocardioides immobilis]|nr:SigE family RNA polymerase sigma factor [Nocardioides immobilis]